MAFHKCINTLLCKQKSWVIMPEGINPPQAAQGKETGYFRVSYYWNSWVFLRVPGWSLWFTWVLAVPVSPQLHLWPPSVQCCSQSGLEEGQIKHWALCLLGNQLHLTSAGPRDVCKRRRVVSCSQLGVLKFSPNATEVVWPYQCHQLF